jgi:transposase
MTTRFVESLNGKLRLFFLPGYSPDLNPDELVWRHVKHHDIGRQLLEDAADLLPKVHSSLRSLQRRPGIIRAFLSDAFDKLRQLKCHSTNHRINNFHSMLPLKKLSYKLRGNTRLATT